MKVAIKLRSITVAFFLVAFALSVALLAQGWISFKFQPDIQGTFLSLTVRFPEGTPYSRSEEVFDIVEDAAAKLKAEKDATFENGEYVETVFVVAEEGHGASLSHYSAR